MTDDREKVRTGDLVPAQEELLMESDREVGFSMEELAVEGRPTKPSSTTPITVTPQGERAGIGRF